MSVTDPYATAAEYRVRVSKTGTGEDPDLDEQLLAVSRLIDREAGRFFTKDEAAVARLYDGNGRTRLYIDDVATATGLVVKVDLDNDRSFNGADETLEEGTHFWAGPANAGKGPEPGPFHYLDIVLGNGRLTDWPERLRAIQVTASFGWPSVPGAIKEATIMIVRELRDLEEAGFTQVLQDIDAAINLSPQAFSIVQRIKRDYSRRVPFA